MPPPPRTHFKVFRRVFRFEFEWGGLRAKIFQVKSGMAFLGGGKNSCFFPPHEPQILASIFLVRPPNFFWEYLNLFSDHRKIFGCMVKLDQLLIISPKKNPEILVFFRFYKTPELTPDCGLVCTRMWPRLLEIVN